MKTSNPDNMVSLLKELDQRLSRQERHIHHSGSAALRDEVAELRAEVAELRAEIEMLRPEGRNGKTTED